MTENEMVDICYNIFKENNKYKNIIREVPFLSRSIDMVLITLDDEIISIEFKLKDWKQAIKQAVDHKNGSDRAYICMPKPSMGFKDDFLNELNEKGIGLIEFLPDSRDGIREIIAAKENKNRWIPNIISLKDIVNRVSNKEIFAV
jgi:hypothetical protein